MSREVRPALINLRNTKIIPFEFQYFEPESIEEALQLLRTYGSEAKILAGGTDLLVKMKIRAVEPKYVINIKRIKELRYIKAEKDSIHIGALTTWRYLEKSDLVREEVPALYDAVKSMGSVQIRNMATVGGNLCNASPAADSAPPLLAHEAKIKLTSIEGTREIPITEFFTGPRKTVMYKTEILQEVVVPYDADFARSYSYVKVGRRNSFTLSVVAVATVLKVRNRSIEDVRVALNAVAPTPVRARSVESFLKGREAGSEVIEKASELVLSDISPISDVRASAEYRKHLSRVLVKDALLKALERAGLG
ncbi:MAG: FAD binding domain-containing protein [Thermoprotei archaeon]